MVSDFRQLIPLPWVCDDSEDHGRKKHMGKETASTNQQVNRVEFNIKIRISKKHLKGIFPFKSHILITHSTKNSYSQWPHDPVPSQ